MVDIYVVYFRKTINKVEIINLFSNQIQIMDFIIRLKSKLAIIMNRFNLIDLDIAKKIIKNVKNASLINKNILTVIITLMIAKIKKLKAQILKLKVKLKDFKYVSRENHKMSQNNKKNRKLLYKRLNHKLIDKKNLKYYKYEKKSHFKSEYQSKPKD